MSIRNQGRPLFPVADKNLYADVWDWGGKMKDSIEGFFNSNKVVLGPNLISNGDFEDDVSSAAIQGWQLNRIVGTGTGTLIVNTSVAFVGTKSAMMSRTNEATTDVSGIMRMVSRYFPLTGFRPYVIHAAAKTESPLETVGGFEYRLNTVRTRPSGDFVSSNAVGGSVIFYNDSMRVTSSDRFSVYTNLIIPHGDVFASLEILNAVKRTMEVDAVSVRSVEFQ